MNLLQWFNQHAISFTLILAYIPLIATVVTTIVSLILVRATLRYSEASDRSLALAREQFEREWAPELHVKLERLSTHDARIMATRFAVSKARAGNPSLCPAIHSMVIVCASSVIVRFSGTARSRLFRIGMRR